MTPVRILTIAVIACVLISFSHAQPIEPQLVDEFEDLPCEDLRERLDHFLAKLSNRKETGGAIVMYEGRYFQYGLRDPKLVFPVFGEVNMRVELFRKHFTFRGFPGETITFVSGGFQEIHRVELWLLLKGSSLPLPKPSLRPVNYRKGSPTDVGSSCP
jgi:hypothetical protein